jgi:hypothetical protein
MIGTETKVEDGGMNWDMITAIAVIVGSIAVAFALLRVAEQMREATRQRDLEAYHIVLGEIGDFCKLIAHDEHNSEIWWRASKGLKHLTDAQRVRYFAMLFILFHSWEKAFRYRGEGEVEDWTDQVVTKPMVDFAMSTGVQEYWALRKRWYTAEFREWVDQQIKGRSGVEVYGDQFRIFGTAEEDATDETD